jgi:ferredoxin-NADP reductase
VDDGLVSTYLLDEAKIGDKLTSSGPQGTFLFNPLIHEKTTIFLAGGSGITPFKSMIEEIVSRGLDRTVYLFYGSKSIDDMIFHDRLSQISSKYDNINYVPVIEAPATGYSGETGFITADLLKKRCQTAEKKTLFICGPQGMYNFCLPEIETFGIPKRKARREMFGTPIHIWEQEGWPSKVSKTDEFSVTVNGSDTIKAVAGESLLVSLEKTGHIVPSLCRSGECSKCRVKIVSGKVYQPPGTPVRKSDRQFGYVHSCVSYPLGNLEILL